MLIEAALDRLNNLSASLEAADFESIKQEVEKGICSMGSPRLADVLLADVLVANNYSDLQVLTLKNLTFENVKNLAENLKNQLEVRFEFAGDVEQDRREEISDRLMAILRCKVGSTKKLQIRQLPAGRSHVKVESALHRGRGLKQYYQIAVNSLESRFLLTLLMSVSWRQKLDTHCLYIKQIELFGDILGFSLSNFAANDEFTPETADDFVMVKMEGIIEQKAEDELQNFASVSIDRDFHDFPELKAKYQKSLKSQVLEFYKTRIQTENLRRLAIEVIGSSESLHRVVSRDLKLKIVTEKAGGDGTWISDLGDFKDSLELYPVAGQSVEDEI
jgi:hypothetical protein